MRKSTPVGARYGEGMTPNEQTPLPMINATGPEPLLAVCCNKCRTVRFARSAEAAVGMTIDHATECGSSNMIMAELVTPAGESN